MKSIWVLSLLQLFFSSQVFAQSLSIMNVGIRAPHESEKNKGQKIEYRSVTGLTITANLDKNRNITSIEIATGPKKVNLQLKDLINKTYKVNYLGISLGKVQGINMNNAGEGIVRITPERSFIGKGFPDSIDLRLARLGAQKQWVVLYGGKTFSSATFTLTKDPYQASATSLLFSPPQLAALETKYFDCTSPANLEYLIKYYKIKDAIQYSGCSLKNLPLSTVSNLLVGAFESFDIYDEYYRNGHLVAADLEKFKSRLKELQELGVDINDIISAGRGGALMNKAVAHGQKNILEYLLSLGLKPDENSYLEAILNVYQFDRKRERIVESPTAKAILELVRSYGPAKPQMDSVVSAVVQDLLDNPIEGWTAEGGQAFSYLDRLFNLAFQEGAIWRLDEDSAFDRDKSEYPTALIDSLSSSDGGVEPILSARDARALIQRIKSSGGQ